jgi:hypothetical protein
VQQWRNPAALQRLREVGAANWDVIDAFAASTPDPSVYDRYLIEAACRLADGATNDDIADYMINVATEELGVDTGSGMRDRALMFARSLREHVEEVVV